MIFMSVAPFLAGLFMSISFNNQTYPVTNISSFKQNYVVSSNNCICFKTFDIKNTINNYTDGSLSAYTSDTYRITIGSNYSSTENGVTTSFTTIMYYDFVLDFSTYTYEVQDSWYFDNEPYNYSISLYYGVSGSVGCYFDNEPLYRIQNDGKVIGSGSYSGPGAYISVSPVSLFYNFYSSSEINDIFGGLVDNPDYSSGYQQGKHDGYEEGYHDGIISSDDTKYDTGYQDGYAVGVADGMSSGHITEIFSNIVQVGILPINVFLAMLNFEVFGINIGSFVSGLLTIAIVIIIMRIVLGSSASGGGGKNDS